MWVTILGHSKGVKVLPLRISAQNCNNGHQTATIPGLYHDGAAFQLLIAAAIAASLNGTLQAYGMVVVEGRTATLPCYG
ncbi:hypothetical protein A2U01_0004766, partial [Trifolium medium]|nr:hypothetical protein [Trifolium medium]